MRTNASTEDPPSCTPEGIAASPPPSFAEESAAAAIRASTSSREICVRTSPLMSSVSVVTPSWQTATYSLSRSAISSQSFVALPRHTGRTPVAPGSSVPVCPIFLMCRIPRSFATTSDEVYPVSLWMMIMPLYGASFFMLSSSRPPRRARCIAHRSSGSGRSRGFYQRDRKCAAARARWK